MEEACSLLPWFTMWPKALPNCWAQWRGKTDSEITNNFSVDLGEAGANFLLQKTLDCAQILLFLECESSPQEASDSRSYIVLLQNHLLLDGPCAWKKMCMVMPIRAASHWHRSESRKYSLKHPVCCSRAGTGKLLKRARVNIFGSADDMVCVPILDPVVGQRQHQTQVMMARCHRVSMKLYLWNRQQLDLGTGLYFANFWFRERPDRRRESTRLEFPLSWTF